MTTYIITFHVKDDDKKIALKHKLAAYKNYCPIHENCWAIISDETPAKIRDDLHQVIDDIDSIFVIRSGTYSAWLNSYGEKNNEWLKEYL
ncbi:hypothetical protein F4X88_16300 [Candidatus Poribacteria bacterium]|nr:hypothetical protein [Candidatus Poribacteria bacterium]